MRSVALCISVLATGFSSLAEAKLSLPQLAESPALVDAAAIHAEDVLAQESLATAYDVRRALRSAGVANPQVIPFAVVGSDRAALRDALHRFVAGRVLSRGMTHFGVSESHDSKRKVLVALFERRLLTLPELPESPPRGGIRVKGRQNVAGAVRAYMTDPGGNVIELPVQKDARRLKLNVPFARGPGRYVFELLVHTQRGPEVAALWPFAVDVPTDPDRRPRPRLSNDRTTLGRLLKRIRARARLAPLTTDAALEQAAQRHAESICRTMIAAHILPGGQTPTARVKAAGYPSSVTENVAIAGSVAEAHDNLLESPSHRKNVLDPGIRVVGIGIASRAHDPLAPNGPRSWCVVEDFGAVQVKRKR